MYDMQGRHIMVTGAAGGIGQEICRYFIDSGAYVFAIDLDEEGLNKLRSALSAKSNKLHTASLDITNFDDIMSAVNTYGDTYKQIDTLINNAGFTFASTLATTTPATWKKDLDLNLTAAFNCVEAVKGAMIDNNEGVIVNIASVNGIISLGDPAYSAAKAGLISYTKSLAMEYGKYRIRANIVAPGTVKTPAWNTREAKNSTVFSDLLKWYPLQNIPEPYDIAAAVGFLASNESRMISGIVLPVDAGLMAGNQVMAGELTQEAI